MNRKPRREFMSNTRWMSSRPTRCRRVAVFLLMGLALALVFGPAQAAYGWFFHTYQTPDSILGSNTIVDIKYDGVYMWLATGKGVTRATPDGTEFVNFGADILNAGEIAAIAVLPGKVWVAPSFSEVRSNQLVPFGAGFNYTDDDGETWGSFTPAQASGGGKICYDLALLERDNSIWAACFYGGLIRSLDGGTTWKNVFPSDADSSDFVNEKYQSLNNRFFSVITDETSADSIMVWAGSAAGIKKFIFLDPSLKLTGTYANDLFHAGDTIWLATEAGASFTIDAGSTWRTYGEDAGFPTSFVSAVAVDPTGVWAGAGSFLDTIGAGIMYSADGGLTWQLSEPPEALGDSRLVADFAYVNGATYAACTDGGLIYTTDEGITWVPIAPAHATAGAYYSLVAHEIDPDTTLLWAGTDDDLYEFIFTSLTEPDTLIKHSVVIETDSDTINLSHSINVVRVQHLSDGNDVLWTLHQETGSGWDLDGFAYSDDRGENWQRAIGSSKPFDIAFTDSVFYLGTENGVVRRHLREPRISLDTLGSLHAVLGGDDSTADVRSLLAYGDSLWVGTDVGIAVSPDSGVTWAKITSPDVTLHYSYTGEEGSISGNFITALALAQHPAGKRIWAATQQTSSTQINGISISADDGVTWEIVVNAVHAWNFAFDGPWAYAATSEGLLVSPDYGTTWDTIDVFVDSFIDSQSPDIIEQGTEVYSVCAIGDTVWVGTENGLAISFDRGETWRIVRRFEQLTWAESTEPYATPVPYSPSNLITPGRLYFHFVPPVDGTAKITILDFSNRVVARIEQPDVHLEAGVQYDQTHFWNGKRAGTDENVAVGTYFFVIEFEDGSTQWGKLVILP